MKKGDWIALIEAGYDLGGSIENWLEKVSEHSAPLLNRGFWPTVGVYDYSPMDLNMQYTKSAGPLLANSILEKSSQLQTDASVRFFRGGKTVTSLSEGIYFQEPEVRHMMRQLTNEKVEDKFAVKALTGQDNALMMCWLFSETVVPTAQERSRWTAIANHLAAGLRLRSFTESLTLEGSRVEAIFDPGGKIHDASNAATSSTAREALRESVCRIEKIRTRSGRSDPDAAMIAWEGLVQGRWSLIDHFDTDQRRFVVAIKNDPDYPDPRGLTKRERQVAEFVGLGKSSKEVSYILGVSHSAVTNCTANTQKKLGLDSRAELAAFFAPCGLRRQLKETSLCDEDILVGSYPLIDKQLIGSLTEAERVVLGMLIIGSTNADIARRRNTRQQTVANQIQSIYRKLQVSSRSQLVSMLQNGSA